MKQARKAIIADCYPSFVKNFFGKIYNYDKSQYPSWAVDALNEIGIDLQQD